MGDGVGDKQKRLRRQLRSFGRLAVALSGGVDSAVLLAEAQAVLGGRVMAFTARSPIHPAAEVADARRIAADLGVPHRIVDSHEMARADFVANPPERCYICKQTVLAQLTALAAENGYQHLAHGANADDRRDYRPGLRAAAELGVAAPLMDAGLTKPEIRRIARDHGLFVWDKPAMACLATRFPYGRPIRIEAVKQVAQAEAVLRAAGFPECRVRHHGTIGRIEVPADRLPGLVADPVRRQLAGRLREIGFVYVAVDLDGYVSGSMNRAMDGPGDPG